MNHSNIPIKLKIGVTGHRIIKNDKDVSNCIRKFISKYLFINNSENNLHFDLRVISPLAEGADRLVAKEVLSFSNSYLTAYLPFNKDEYVKDFTSDESINEFNQILNSADEVHCITYLTRNELSFNSDSLKSIKEDAYLKMGKLLVEKCDIIIAIWDGMPASGKGGTAEIVNYALQNKKAVVIINPINLKVSYFHNHKIDFSSIEKYERIIDEKCSDTNIKKDVNELFLKTFPNNEKYKSIIHSDFKNVLLTRILPFYNSYDKASIKSQRKFKPLAVVFWIAFISSFAISFGVSFFQNNIPNIFFAIEGIALFLVFSIYIFSKKIDPHSSWIENRIMAERIRLLMFTSIFRDKSTSPNNFVNVGNKNMKKLFILFYYEIINSFSLPNYDYKEIVEYLSLLFKHQILYHNNKNKLSSRWEKLTTHLTIIIFFVAFIISISHIIGIKLIHLPNNQMIFLSLILPPLISAIGAIKYLRNYNTISLSSEVIIEKMNKLEHELQLCKSTSEIKDVVIETERLYLEELERWYVLVRKQDLELAL